MPRYINAAQRGRGVPRTRLCQTHRGKLIAFLFGFCVCGVLFVWCFVLVKILFIYFTEFWDFFLRVCVELDKTFEEQSRLTPEEEPCWMPVIGLPLCFNCSWRADWVISPTTTHRFLRVDSLPAAAALSGDSRQPLMPGVSWTKSSSLVASLSAVYLFQMFANYIFLDWIFQNHWILHFF